MESPDDQSHKSDHESGDKGDENNTDPISVAKRCRIFVHRRDNDSADHQEPISGGDVNLSMELLRSISLAMLSLARFPIKILDYFLLNMGEI